MIELIKDILKPHRVQMRKWREADGDNTLRLNYPLNSESIVFDVGGYKGYWAYKINQRYDCVVYIFEPLKEFYEIIVKRFKSNPKIKVFNFGFNGFEGEFKIYFDDDASSAFSKGGGEYEIVLMKDLPKFLKENKIKSVDLMKLNIEGGEYSLLRDLFEFNEILKFKHIQVQFHRNFHDYRDERNYLRTRFAWNFEEQYNFPFVWESWKLKK